MDVTSYPLQLPSGVQSPTGGKPPLASPGGHAPPQRSGSERSLSGALTPGRGAPSGLLAGSGGSGSVAAAAAVAASGKSSGMQIKGDRGRFKVYEVGLLPWGSLASRLSWVIAATPSACFLLQEGRLITVCETY